MRVPNLRVIVCGGRDFGDIALLEKTLDRIDRERGPIMHLFHGNARGADTLADYWGKRQPHVRVHPTPANWTKYGKRAGPIRNQNMLGQKPNLVIAFPGGSGTADMVNRAKAAGVEVIEVAPTSPASA